MNSHDISAITADNNTIPALQPPEQVISGMLQRQGAGVRNIVTIGANALPMLDPFLLLAEFGGEDSVDYAGGFPHHPHRGFETLTYVIEGRLKHGDSRGNGGRLGPGAVQRMKAARGIFHSEMPDQLDGPLRALQLWINLPARHKLDDPGYQDIQGPDVPSFERGGVTVRVLVGSIFGVASPIPGGATDLMFLDVKLQAGAGIEIPVSPDYSAVAYGIDGQSSIGGRILIAQCLFVLTPGAPIVISVEKASRLVILAARPIGEPVARHGPFVMNTDAEIYQALADLQAGRLD